MVQLSDTLIIQLNIFKYIDGISKKFIPNLSIDEEISLQGNRMVVSGIIYHEREQSQFKQSQISSEEKVKVHKLWL